MLSSLNAVISTNESIEFITGHVIYNLAYTYKFQLKTTLVSLESPLKKQLLETRIHHLAKITLLPTAQHFIKIQSVPIFLQWDHKSLALTVNANL